MELISPAIRARIKEPYSTQRGSFEITVFLENVTTQFKGEILLQYRGTHYDFNCFIEG